jgi:hypothetical protein
MKTLLLCTLLLVGCAHAPNPCDRRTSTVHEFGFRIAQFPLEHQGEQHKLDLDVRYHYADKLAVEQYPDFVPLDREVREFLTNYKPEETFWEVVNEQLATRLLEKNPSLADVTIEIQVDPTSRLPYRRHSRVTRSRAGCLMAPQ